MAAVVLVPLGTTKMPMNRNGRLERSEVNEAVNEIAAKFAETGGPAEVHHLEKVRRPGSVLAGLERPHSAATLNGNAALFSIRLISGTHEPQFVPARNMMPTASALFAPCSMAAAMGADRT